MSKYARRVDSVQADIVAGLRFRGFDVMDLSGVGGGVPDLLISRDGVMSFVEVKSPGGKLTPAQEKFRKRFKTIVAFRIQDVLREYEK